MLVMFQKRHYEKIAEVLRQVKPEQRDPQYFGRFITWTAIRRSLMDLFKSDSPKFNEDKFYEATNK